MINDTPTTRSHRRVDAHVHFWTLARGDYDWMTPDLDKLHRDFRPEDLAPHLDKAGMHEAVIVQAAATIDETEFILAIAGHTDFVAGVVGWIDMEAETAADDLARLCGNPLFKGIRPMIHDIPDPRWMLDDALTPAFEAVIAHDLAFDCLVKPPHLKPLLQLLQRHPDLRALIDHAGKPEIAAGHFDAWAADIKRLADETGALCKFSGLITEAGPGWSIDTLRPYAEHLIDCFGPKRLVFGSDWPVITMTATYEDWFAAANELTADLGDDDRARIFGDNAVDFYRL